MFFSGGLSPSVDVCEGPLAWAQELVLEGQLRLEVPDQCIPRVPLGAPVAGLGPRTRGVGICLDFRKLPEPCKGKIYLENLFSVFVCKQNEIIDWAWRKIGIALTK